MSKIILFVTSDDFFLKSYYEKYGINIVNIMKKNNFLYRRLISIFSRTCPPLLRWFYRDVRFNKDDKCIIIDANYNLAVKIWLKKIKYKYGLNNIYIWLWNPAYKISSDIKELKKLFHVASYSKNDCKHYGIKNNSTFYFKEIRIPKNEIEYDVYFLGRAKNRMDRIVELKKQFETMNLKVKFIVTKTSRMTFLNSKQYSSYISYDDNLSIISKSKVLLEILDSPADGMSLRAMEALFLQKKLITNCSEVKTSMFYNKANIFIIGEDDMGNLKSFIQSDSVPYNEAAKKYYNFDSWLNRWINE